MKSTDSNANTATNTQTQTKASKRLTSKSALNFNAEQSISSNADNYIGILNPTQKYSNLALIQSTNSNELISHQTHYSPRQFLNAVYSHGNDLPGSIQNESLYQIDSNFNSNYMKQKGTKSTIYQIEGKQYDIIFSPQSRQGEVNKEVHSDISNTELKLNKNESQQIELAEIIAKYEKNSHDSISQKVQFQQVLKGSNSLRNINQLQTNSSESSHDNQIMQQPLRMNKGKNPDCSKLEGKTAQQAVQQLHQYLNLYQHQSKSTDKNTNKIQSSRISEQQKKLSTSVSTEQNLSIRDQNLQNQEKRSQNQFQVYDLENKRQNKYIEDIEVENRNLKAEVRQLNRQMIGHDQLYLKMKEIKTDYKQLLVSFENSEQIRREQKQFIQAQKTELKKTKYELSKYQLKLKELQKSLNNENDYLERQLSSNRSQSRASSRSCSRSRTNSPKQLRQSNKKLRQQQNMRKTKKAVSPPPLIINLQTPDYNQKKLSTSSLGKVFEGKNRSKSPYTTTSFSQKKLSTNQKGGVMQKSQSKTSIVGGKEILTRSTTIIIRPKK